MMPTRGTSIRSGGGIANNTRKALRDQAHGGTGLKKRFVPVLAKPSYRQAAKSVAYDLFDEEFYAETFNYQTEPTQTCIKDNESGIAPIVLSNQGNHAKTESNLRHINFNTTEPDIRHFEDRKPLPDAAGVELNYIDSLYFPQESQESSNNPLTGAEVIPGKASEAELDDLNVFDQGLLEDYVNQNCFIHNSSSNDTLRSNGNAIRQQIPINDSSIHQQVPIDVRELNYFDQVMIGNGITEDDIGKLSTEKNISCVVKDPKAARGFNTDSSSSETYYTDQEHEGKKLESSNLRRQREAKGKITLQRLVPCLEKEPSYAVIDLLVNNIVYQDEKVVCINKPFRLSCQGGKNIHHNVHKYLPEIAKRLKHDARLFLCHRLDKDTSGLLLLAKNEESLDCIKSRFKDRLVDKIYLAVTKGVPDPLSGEINIPLNIDSRRGKYYKSRLVAHDTKSKNNSIYAAVTRYQVLKKTQSAALVQLQPITGRKHQIRVHLADVLNTPIIGDHKYSNNPHQELIAPQKLPSDILHKLKLAQSKVRHVPMHLHAHQLTLHKYFEDGKPLVLSAKLPAYFARTIKLLKMIKI